MQTRPPCPHRLSQQQQHCLLPSLFLCQNLLHGKNYNIYNKYDNGNPKTLSCGSNSLSILSVSYFQVFDSGTYLCNCNAGSPGSPVCDETTALDCQGQPIEMYFAEFMMDIQISGTEYDIALYINSNSGLNGAVKGNGGCLIQGLSSTDADNNTYVNVTNLDNDGCLDVTTGGTLLRHPFPKITLSCSDPNNDGLLDIRIGATFAQNDSKYLLWYGWNMQNMLENIIQHEEWCQHSSYCQSLSLRMILTKEWYFLLFCHLHHH